MSDIAKRPDDALSPLPGERKNPLRLLPEPWRQPVGFFYAFHSDILKGSMGIVTRMRLWIQEEGLTLDEAKSAMKKAMRPDVCGSFAYVGQMMERLSLEISETMKRRKVEEARAKKRAEDEEAKQRSAPASQVREMLKGIGESSNA